MVSSITGDSRLWSSWPAEWFGCLTQPVFTGHLLGMGEAEGCSAQGHGFQSHDWLHHLPVIWPWASYSTFLCLSFITSKMGITIVLASLSCCEDLKALVYVKGLKHSKLCISVCYFYYTLVSGDNMGNKWQFWPQGADILLEDSLYRKPGNRQFHTENSGSGQGCGGHQRGSTSPSGQGGLFDDGSAESWSADQGKGVRNGKGLPDLKKRL